MPHHGQVDVAGGELHVDLLVDHGLGGGVKVLADLGHGYLRCFGEIGLLVACAMFAGACVCNGRGSDRKHSGCRDADDSTIAGKRATPPDFMLVAYHR